MGALLKDWNQVAAVIDDIPEDELADMDPAAHAALVARKAHKMEQEAAIAEFEDRRIKAKAEEQHRQETAQMEAALIRADQWDHSVTEFGGKRMSQAEAQDVREYITGHRADVVDWGLRNGQFKTEAEGHGYVDRTGRLHELNAADRDGALSDEQRAERARLEQQQRPYSAVDMHWDEVMQHSRVSHEAALPTASMPCVPDPIAAPVANDDNPFRSRAPDMKASFAMQASPLEAPQIQSEAEVIRPAQATAKPLAMAGLS